MNDKSGEQPANPQPRPAPPPRSDAPPKARPAPRSRLSWAWLAPIATVIIAGVLGYQAIQERGTVITIHFDQAHGLSPDDAIIYRGLRVGAVRSVTLDESLGSVKVEASIRKDAEALAVEGSRFWVVRPELSLRKISGLDTLFGPRYIEVKPGDGAPTDSFDGLLAAPELDEPEPQSLKIVVKATRRGSITVGAPVLYRDVIVGEVRNYSLAPDATGVLIDLEVEPRFAPLVRESSRFWNVSGVAFDWGIFSGLSVQADSIETIVTGGVAFATPERRPGERVSDGHQFVLESGPEEDWLRWAPEIDITGAPTAASDEAVNEATGG
jgi:paraquat-inducible protein B